MSSLPASPRLRWALTVVLMAALGCELSPEKARAKLADQGIPFPAEEFVRRAGKDSWSTLELFLRAGMDPNRKADASRSLEGVTALMVASSAGRCAAERRGRPPRGPLPEQVSGVDLARSVR